MILKLLITAAAFCAFVAVFGFVQYARYRMNENEEKEVFYRDLHYIALFLLFVIGVVVMFYLGAQP